MKVIFFTTLLLFSINGFAFNWKKVSEDTKGNSFYVDIDNIKKHNGLVYYWELADYLEPLKGIANSDISKYKANCEEGKTIRINSTYYSQSMGRGKIITETTPNKTNYPKPTTIEYIQMKFACNNAR